MKKRDNFVIHFVSFIIILIFLCFILWFINYIVNVFFYNKNYKEGFTWSKNCIDDFLIFQKTINPNTQFNMEMVQQQASEDEAKYLLANGYWPWTEETTYSFMEAIGNNTMLRVPPEQALAYQKKVYNENAMKQLLGWNTKEGQFLIYGGIGNSGKEVIKCDLNGNGMKKMNKNKYDFYDRVKPEYISNDIIPKEMPGFEFVGNSCNPCVALENDYSCPFTLNIKGDKSISNIWKQRWQI